MSEAMVRHDVANQLAVILGFSELLLAETPVDDPRRPDLQAIHDAATKALAILTNTRQGGSAPS